MKSMKNSTKKILERIPISKKESESVKIDPFDTSLLGIGIPNYVIDPTFPPVATPEQLEALDLIFQKMEKPVKMPGNFSEGEGIKDGFNTNEVWIQTYSGRRFNPINPNPDAIVIQDIAHALSMQCRFSGHSKDFYSVAQHSVLVSYICDQQDALWGLLHDATEAYLVDVPRPLKRSGKLQGYIEIESVMQDAICRRFALPHKEPPSVKMADTLLLATEARDLMSPLHSTWQQSADPLPFKIEPWNHQKAKNMFMKRFFELTVTVNANSHYEHYLKYKDIL